MDRAGEVPGPGRGYLKEEEQKGDRAQRDIMGLMQEKLFLTPNTPFAMLCLHSGAVGARVRQRGWPSTGQDTDRGHGAAARG